MKTLIALAIVIGMLSPSPGRAGGVLVELFTSQGCSSCPPADRVMLQLAGRADVVALALHVDYWDYLGWRDTFGQAEFTARQREYSNAWGRRVIYTPQAVVQGQSDVLGSDLAAMDRAIAAGRVDGPDIAIALSQGMLVARITPAALARSASILVARYRSEARVEIERGELAGQTMTYANVALGVDRLGPWDGASPREVMLPQLGPGEGVAVWLQDGLGGPVLAAAKYEP